MSYSIFTLVDIDGRKHKVRAFSTSTVEDILKLGHQQYRVQMRDVIDEDRLSEVLYKPPDEFVDDDDDTGEYRSRRISTRIMVKPKLDVMAGIRKKKKKSDKQRISDRLDKLKDVHFKEKK